MTDQELDQLADQIRHKLEVEDSSLNKLRDTLLGKDREHDEEEIIESFEYASKWYGSSARVALRVKQEFAGICERLEEGWPHDLEAWGDLRTAAETFCKMRDRRLESALRFDADGSTDQLLKHEAQREIARRCHNIIKLLNKKLEEENEEPVDLSIDPGVLGVWA